MILRYGENMTKEQNKLWTYPLIFGILGAFIGLVLRYTFANPITGFPLKNVIHSHSHIILLGFLFNALVVLLWTRFTNGIDKVSFRYYLALQVCISVMLVAFILQGYAAVSITFSTLHLWISYILLIRLWKRLKGNKNVLFLIKTGIVFHFIASIGPYCLGPLMVLQMQESPWYQQAIFFYLHFQYFGSFFLWLLAVFFQKASISVSKNQALIIIASCIFIYAHSLDYNFNHWLIQLFGGVGSVLLLGLLFSLKKHIKNISKPYQIFFYSLLLVAIINVIGSFPQMANLVEDNRFILIAYLHFLFLGIYMPFIWMQLNKNIHSSIWWSFALIVLFSELLLIFPYTFSNLFSISIMWLLFIAYLGVFLCICIVHLKHLFKPYK